jgi:hypothetical protein
MSFPEIGCLIIDDKQNPIGSCFTVELPQDARAHHLARKVKEWNPCILANVGIASLKLWRIANPIPVGDLEELEEEVMHQRIQDIRLVKKNIVPADNALLSGVAPYGESFSHS